MQQRTGTLMGSHHFREGQAIFVNRAEEAFDLSYHAHDFIEISYIAEGRGYHHIGDEIIAVSKGDLFVLPIGAAHVFRPASVSVKLVVYNCVFTPAVMVDAAALIHDQELFAMLRLQEGQPETGYGLRDTELTLEPLFIAMLEEHATMRAGFSAMLYAHLIRLLVQIARKLTLDTSRAPASFGIEDPIGEAMDYIRRHSHESLTVKMMADRSSLSERHFFRLFKQRTGQPFHHFIQYERIRRACELLAFGGHKVAAVAEAVGYKDVQTFNKVFKQHAGMTPGQYRKQVQAKPKGNDSL